MDVHMPGTSGIDATHDLLVSRPSTRVILLTASTSTRTVAAAAQAGAVGFLVKGGAHDRLISAVRTVAAGGTAWPIDPQVAGAAPGK
jgi:DNA-binding NarL/FixJ family response regulator